MAGRKMIVAESIGFAATHTISSILADLPGYRVTHGSQNFETGVPIGAGSQTPAGFAASMVAAKSAGQRPVALHTNFDPRQFLPACQAQGVHYGLLVRRPEAQIESCYAWALTKVLQGDDQMLLVALKAGLQPLNDLRIRASLPNLLYAYALTHVCQFNLAAVEAGAEFMQMETLLADEAAFRAAFAVPGEVPIAHFSGEARHLASHRAKPELEAVAAPEREAIRAAMPVAVGAVRTSVGQLAARLGYAA